MKKFLAAGKIQQRCSSIYNGKQSSLFSFFFFWNANKKGSFHTFKPWIYFCPTKHFM